MNLISTFRSHYSHSIQPIVRVLMTAALLSQSTLAFAQETQPQSEEAQEVRPQLFLPMVANMGTAVERVRGAVVPNQFIVLLNEEQVTASSVSATAQEMLSEYDAEILQTYAEAIHGFAVNFAPEQSERALEQLRQDPRIASIEPDHYVSVAEEEQIAEQTEGETIQDAQDVAEVLAGTQFIQYNPPSWGLDRIGQRSLPLNSMYGYTNLGTGVRVYIIDTGIRTSHVEFAGRARDGVDTIDGALPAQDCYGHGTHVAGTVGGTTYGVAKNVQLIAVRVLDCDGWGTDATVMAGVDWVTSQKRTNPTIPMVANMSLGGGISAALDAAVQRSINAGVSYAIAAGNDNSDACLTSPARVSAAVTVGATDSKDYRAYFSNFGKCVDLFAPGVDITSALNTSDTASATWSGTSMATPHIAGVMALYLQSRPSATPSTVASALITLSTKKVVKDAKTGSPNRLLFTNY